jgi:hypothetical protein
MFKNREFRIKMVNPDKTPVAPAPTEEELVDKVALAAVTIKSVVWTAAGAMVTYVAADTLRRVAVELAKK